MSGSLPRLDINAIWDTWVGDLCYWIVAHGQDDVYRALVAHVTALVQEGEILDDGCGPGTAGVILAKALPKARVTGLDLAPRMVAAAEERARRERVDNAGFVAGTALDLPFAEGRFDAVYTIDSIKLWPDKHKGVAEIHRVLKPGGWMLVMELDHSAPAEVIARLQRLPPLSLAPRLAFRMVFRASFWNGALDPDQARAFMRATPFRDFTVERLPEVPLLLICARKE